MRKELLILSGKGGTGKTSITAALAHLAAPSKIIADCDVDASDLHLILAPEIRSENDFISGTEAKIRRENCTACGECSAICQFDAIETDDEGIASVNGMACEGCAVCARFCPAEAITMHPCRCGQWFLSDTRFGPMVHSHLFPGEENSGKLVTLVKNQATQQAENLDKKLILVDGPPGIGCPVIASISGADLVLIVTEPTMSGLHDLERVIGLTTHFKVPAAVCLNKCDLNGNMAKAIERYCTDNGIEMIAAIPFDQAFTDAQVQGKAVTELQESGVSQTLEQMWFRLNDMLFSK